MLGIWKDLSCEREGVRAGVGVEAEVDMNICKGTVSHEPYYVMSRASLLETSAVAYFMT